MTTEQKTRKKKLGVGLAALSALAVATFDATARQRNYDEEKVAPYTLEDPLAFADGVFENPDKCPAPQGLQRMIDKVAANGGGRVVVPAGRHRGRDDGGRFRGQGKA